MQTNRKYLSKRDVPQQLLGIHGYKGTKYAVEPVETVKILEIRNNYWSGGTKSYWGAVELATGRATELPSMNPLAASPSDFRVPVAVRPGIAVWEHRWFCGKDMGVTFYIHPSNMTQILPRQSDALSNDEQIVINYTCAYTSSYRFIRAQQETGITKARWDAAKESLIGKKLLAKNGAVTSEGRNMRTK